ncbi:MAG: SpoIID/LytB domain-containing protein [Clostridium sp.]
MGILTVWIRGWRGVFPSSFLERYGVRTYLSVEDYLPGVMVCQIGPEMGMEALKCQAVIARTYIYRQMGDREEIQEEELDLDYLGDDTARAGKYTDRASEGGTGKTPGAMQAGGRSHGRSGYEI